MLPIRARVKASRLVLSGEQKVLRKRPALTSLPESREKNRFLAGDRRSNRQQRQPNQALKKADIGCVRESAEGGRSASEGASREGLAMTYL